jgi:hypothetical protein
MIFIKYAHGKHHAPVKKSDTATQQIFVNNDLSLKKHGIVEINNPP